MDNNFIVALVSITGTIIGSFGGILTSTKLTNYRLDKLEKKVDQHNNFAERIPVLEERVNVLKHRIEDLQRECNNEN